MNLFEEIFSVLEGFWRFQASGLGTPTKNSLRKKSSGQNLLTKNPRKKGKQKSAFPKDFRDSNSAMAKVSVGGPNSRKKSAFHKNAVHEANPVFWKGKSVQMVFSE